MAVGDGLGVGRVVRIDVRVAAGVVDVAGGFEVHLSEGYAHVDIVTAEDDASNAVIGPLIELLRRNSR